MLTLADLTEPSLKSPNMYKNNTSHLLSEKRVVLLIAVLAGFIPTFDSSAVNIALRTMGSEFHIDAISLSWVATAYLLASAVFLIPLGKIADIYGRKKIFLWKLECGGRENPHALQAVRQLLSVI